MATVRRIFSKYFWGYLIFFVVYFGWLWINQLVVTEQGWVAGSDRTWADGAAHLSYISAFVERGFWLPQHPLFLGEVYSYPPMSDWLAALLVLVGIPLPMAFSLVGFGLSMAVVVGLYAFYYVMFGKKSSVAVISSLLFLWSGGLGFLYLIFNTLTHESLGKLPPRVTEMTDYGVRFINTIDAELLPQRAFLMGLPVGLLLLVLLWRWWEGKLTDWRHYLLGGVLLGILPLIHPHTLIVMAIITAWVFGYQMLATKSIKPIWGWWIGPAGILGGLLTFLQTRGLEESFFWIKWGWLAGDMKVNWVWFWFLNWGLWLVLVLVGYWKLPKRVRWFLVPFGGIFVLANIVMFQPYDWDNSKILTWVHLAFSGVAGWWLWQIWNKKILWKRVVVVVAFMIACVSGLIDSMRLVNIPEVSFALFSVEEVQLAEWIRTNTDPDRIFLTSDSHRHFVPTLTGRQILMGYRGWMWSYGIDYRVREADVLLMFAGKPGSLELLKQYGVDYVVIGPMEKDLFYKANEQFFDEHFVVVHQSSTTKIYQVN